MPAPEVVQPIPGQVVNEQAAYGPFNLKEYIKTADNAKLQFSAELRDGGALPKGMICTEDGILTGIPAKGTQGNYEIKVSAKNDEGEVEAIVLFTIKPSLAGGDYLDTLKTQIWEALEQNLPIPDLTEMYSRPITALDIYYILERWGILTIWDAYNIEPPGPKVSITLEGASKHYNTFDRGNCLVAAPKDLFSHERTLLDGIMTAQALAREAYKRNWTIEIVGFDKLMRAAWIEVQRLGKKHGKPLEVINFKTGPDELYLYNNQVVSGPKSSFE